MCQSVGRFQAHISDNVRLCTVDSAGMDDRSATLQLEQMGRRRQ